ncbi:Killing trait [Pseudovibrio axinellae]|uniref:Killing trait n=1 Tax=Pseudovibrio axinellae TaxID=989403 RepID=A0A166AQA0_9HYPH|nr:RebB family R body protein [Pseudovibrio axinellae]KZL21416.1 Killing trait [Pseudovibrio axinellae]SEQ99450.1 Killing trait domain-containing protein [Pseudovibrio axinellae]
MPKTIEKQSGVSNNAGDEAFDANPVEVLGVAPAFAMALTYLSAAQSTGILFENAVANAQRQNIIAQSALNQGILHMFSVGSMAAANSTSHMDSQDGEQVNESLLSSLRRYFSN